MGQKVKVVLDAYPNDSVEAIVDHIAYESETVNNVTIYKVDVLPVKVPDHFTSGMTAQAAIEITSRENVILVPMEAIEEKQGKKSALVKKKGERKAEATPVEVGLNNGTSYEILSGISEGDVITVKGKPQPDKKKSSKRRTIFSA